MLCNEYFHCYFECHYTECRNTDCCVILVAVIPNAVYAVLCYAFVMLNLFS
jgi:hypothetical protein